jgi:branched-chain amino acid transport system permease protein
MASLLQLLFSGLEIGSIYALASLGIMLIFRTSTVTNFAQGIIGMFSAFFVAAFVMRTTNVVTFALIISALMVIAITRLLYIKGIPLGLSIGISILPSYMFVLLIWLLGPSIWSATILGLITAFLTGVLIDFVIIRRAQKVNPLAKQIITMGLVIVFLGITPMIFNKMLIGADPVRIPKFITEGAITISGASLSYNSLFNIVVGLIIMIGLFVFLQKTKWGLAVRVTASNPQTAKMMGVPTKLVTVGSWAVAAMLGTLAAIMYAPIVGIITPGYMTVIQVVAFVACVFGGFQTFHGPVIAAYIVAIVRNILIFYGSSFLQIFFGSAIQSDFGSIWGEQILYILIIILIIFRPYGLIGKKIVKKV